jgi:hypothetical protein
VDGWIAHAKSWGLVPFGAHRRDDDWLMLFILGGVGVDLVVTNLRQLRALPLSLRQLETLILTLPLVSWVTWWMLLAAFHLLFVDEPLVSLRLPTLLALIGLDNLVRAARRRWSHPGWLLAFIFVATPLIIAIKRFELPIDFVSLAIGVAANVAAWLINRDTLLRSRKAYTTPIPKSMFGTQFSR